MKPRSSRMRRKSERKVVMLAIGLGCVPVSRGSYHVNRPCNHGRHGDFGVAEVRRAIGLMSGTSLDGVDVALIETDGERIAAFGPARTFPYARGGPAASSAGVRGTRER